MSHSALGNGPGSLTVFMQSSATGIGHGDLLIFKSQANIVQPGVWQHVALSYDNVTAAMQLFLNGNIVAQGTAWNVSGFPITPATSSDLYLGFDPGGLNFRGGLDEICLYSRALTQSEIVGLALANSAKCRPRCGWRPWGAVSVWAGAGNGNDSIGTNTAMLMNGATFAPGKVGNGFKLDGVSAYLRVEDSPSLRPGAGSFTIETWVRTSRSGVPQTIVEKYECGGSCPSGADNSDYAMGINANGTLYAYLRDSDQGGDVSGGQQLIGNHAVNDGVFHHVAMVRDTSAGHFQLYLDGGLEADGLFNPGASGTIKDDDNEADPLTIGASMNAGSTEMRAFFEGTIDELAYYNRALGDSEIQSIHWSGSAGKCLEPVYITGVARSSGSAKVSWLSQKGMTYRLQYTTQLLAHGATVWIDLGPVVANADTTTVTDTLPANAPQRFYRVIMSE
jgi:hypothetical protein